MSAFFASGHAVDLVLAVMLVESIVLIRRRRRDIAAIILGTLPGALILLALRAALTGGGWPVVAFWLAVSFPAHLLDLRRRGLLARTGDTSATTSASTSDKR